MENIAQDAYQIIHLHKYLSLKRRCEEVQLANEKLVNRIYNVKKILKRYKKERSALMSRLDEHDDNYQEVFVPAMWTDHEDEEKTEEFIPDEETDQAVASISGLSKSELPVPEEQTLGMSLTTFTSEPKKIKKGKTPSPYMLFCSHRKAPVQQEYLEKKGEEASRAELTKILSQEWARISQEEKLVYAELAENKKHESYECQQSVVTTVKADETQVPLEFESVASLSFTKKE